MKIAILSDSHDQIPNLVRAVDRANREGAAALIHCGDLISPFMLEYLARFQGAIHLIYGNNAGDQHLVSSRCAGGLSRITHHGIQGSVVLDGLRIGFLHYPKLARALAGSGEFDVVCCGHDHIYAVERIGACLLLNPGDLLGRDDPPGFLLLDTVTRQATRLIVGPLLDFSPYSGN